MVKDFKIGIIGIQGAISEHIISMKKTLKKNKINGNVFIIKNKNDLNKIDALLLPGGESTTISKILNKSGIFNDLFSKIKEDNIPVMGTCAGCVLLSSDISNNGDKIKLLSVMDMKVKRNAFGRQKESFETNVKIKGFSKPYNAIFIRAPLIERVWGNCEILSKIDDKIIMAKQNNLIAISFHPELTDDLRIHEYFLNMIWFFKKMIIKKKI